MQTLEATFSFLFFFLIAAYALTQLEYTKPNYDIYKYQLANDIWRVVYLKNGLSYYPLSQPIIENQLNEIKDKTGLCAYIEGIDTTSCRGISCTDSKITMEKIWFKYGQPNVVRFTMCVPSS